MQIDLLSMVGGVVSGVNPAKPVSAGEFKGELDQAMTKPLDSAETQATEDRSGNEPTKEATSDLPNADDTQLPDSSPRSETDLTPTMSALLSVLVWPPVAPLPLLDGLPAPSGEPVAAVTPVVPGPQPALEISEQAPALPGPEPTNFSDIALDSLPPSSIEIPVVNGEAASAQAPEQSKTPPTDDQKLEVTVPNAPDLPRVANPKLDQAEVELMNPVRLDVKAPESEPAQTSPKADPAKPDQSAQTATNTNQVAEAAVPKPKIAVESPAPEPKRPVASPTGQEVAGTEPIAAEAKAQAETPNQDSNPDESAPEQTRVIESAPAPVRAIRVEPEPQAKAAAVPVDEVIRQAADRIDELAARRSGGTVTIHLEPRELGQLTLVVRQLNGRVEAEIQASDPTVREQLQTNQAQLHHQLERKGMQVEALRFTDTAQSNVSQNHSQGSHEQLTREDFERSQHLRSASVQEATSVVTQPWWHRNADGLDMTA